MSTMNTAADAKNAPDSSSAPAIREYLVRHGVMGVVSRCAWLAEATTFGNPKPERGTRVVLRSQRGEEMGEILTVAETASALASASSSQAADDVAPGRGAWILRLADPTDELRARTAAHDLGRRFSLCSEMLAKWAESVVVLDVEALLDEGRTVIHYFGPPAEALAHLHGKFFRTTRLDVRFEPATLGLHGGASPAPTPSGCGGCALRSKAGKGCAGCA